MLVKHRMTPNPVTVTPETSFPEAFNVMNERKIRYLPVLDKRNKLVGIVTQKDLLQASPSSATTLSIFEVNYLLAKLQVREVMSSPVIIVSEDAPLEEAARVMVENTIAALPVMRGDELIGIITETDIFRAMVEIMGDEQATLRVTVRVPNVPGELARLSETIARLGGDIRTVAAFTSEDPDYGNLTFRLRGVDEKALVKALEAQEEHVVNVCPVGANIRYSRSTK
jgi:acetoin utilization protein AcuB